MKRIFSFFLAGTILSLAACDSASVKGTDGSDSAGKKSEMSPDANSAEAKEERNKQTALASVEAMSKHDASLALKDVTQDAVDYNDGSWPPVKSKDSAMHYVSMWLTAFPDVKGENLKAVSDGEWVIVWGDWSGTWKGDFMGQKATGKSYKVRDADIFRFNDDGKITEHHILSTSAAVASQVGMKME